MKPFAVALQAGDHVLGLGLSSADLERIAAGEKITLTLSSVGAGLWYRTDDGGRIFLQPHNSRIVLVLGDTNEEIGRFLGVTLP